MSVVKNSREESVASRKPIVPGLGTQASRTLGPGEWRQFAAITLAAVAIFLGFRLLPTGTNLSHMDFRLDPKAGNAIEFCDPLNPQFIPVVATRSPVNMVIATDQPARSRVEVRATITLRTSSGRPITPEDLLVTHTRRLHVLLIDPALSDYQHVHPQPTAIPGEWAFSFTPSGVGTYRVFADFTPAATGRGLYASTDLPVSTVGNLESRSGKVADATIGSSVVESDGFRFALTTTRQPVRAGEVIDLRFGIRALTGAVVPLEPVMGAYAHLVAFDESRSGFAHLHPAEADLLKRPDANAPELNFKLTIPRSGRYVVWAQVNVAGRETFLPFALQVVD